MNITIKTTVNPGLSRLHERLILNRADTMRAIEAADAAFRALMARNFDTEGSAGGPKWAPNSAFTRALKAELGFPDAVLVRTGGMKRGLTEKGGDHVARVKGGGSLVELELGAMGRTADLVEKNIDMTPSRDAAQMTEAGKAEIEAAVKEAVRNVLKRALVLEIKTL